MRSYRTLTPQYADSAFKVGFSERIRGSHFIYARQGVAEIINLQPRGGKAKPYQVRQVRGLVIRYALKLEDGEE